MGANNCSDTYNLIHKYLHFPKKSTCMYKNGHNSIKIEFLAWIDSFMCAESNGASFMKKNIDYIQVKYLEWSLFSDQIT